MTEDNKDLLLFRLQEAHEALNDSKILFDRNSYRASVNRSYYSMFYSMICLAYSIGIDTSKHSHVISTFDKEFVKSGKFTKENSKWIHEAFKKRQESDYLDFKEVNREESEQIYSLVNMCNSNFATCTNNIYNFKGKSRLFFLAGYSGKNWTSFYIFSLIVIYAINSIDKSK